MIDPHEKLSVRLLIQLKEFLSVEAVLEGIGLKESCRHSLANSRMKINLKCNPRQFRKLQAVPGVIHIRVDNVSS